MREGIQVAVEHCPKMFNRIVGMADRHGVEPAILARKLCVGRDAQVRTDPSSTGISVKSFSGPAALIERLQTRTRPAKPASAIRRGPLTVKQHRGAFVMEKGTGRAEELALGNTQVGRCGKILVQYHLLRHGVDSAPITADLGIDLVAYSPWTKLPFTLQVETTLRPKPAGLKGMALDWWLSGGSPAEFVALVELQHERIWALTREELATVAQAASGGRLHVFLYTDRDARPLTGARGNL